MWLILRYEKTEMTPRNKYISYPNGKIHSWRIIHGFFFFVFSYLEYLTEFLGWNELLLSPIKTIYSKVRPEHSLRFQFLLSKVQGVHMWLQSWGCCSVMNSVIMSRFSYTRRLNSPNCPRSCDILLNLCCLCDGNFQCKSTLSCRCRYKLNSDRPHAEPWWCIQTSPD